MTRLPCFDETTRRSEFVVFASLGIAAFVSVALAAAQMLESVVGGDRSSAVRAEPPAVVTGQADRLSVTTNINSPADQHGVCCDLATDKRRAAGGSRLGLLLL